MRGVFMRDTLPKVPLKIECGIFNLQPHNLHGSHWVAYKKKNNKVFYFDSFGNLPPPKEFVKYMRGCEIYYNFYTYQTFEQSNCGWLCIDFLKNKKLKPI